MWLVPSVWNLMRCCFLREKINMVGSKCMKPEMLFPKRQNKCGWFQMYETNELVLLKKRKQYDWSQVHVTH